jgi:hypothetical protein
VGQRADLRPVLRCLANASSVHHDCPAEPGGHSRVLQDGSGPGNNRGEDAMTNNLASDVVTLVARLNIEHFRKKLADESDETKRLTLLQLIAEETAKLLSPVPESLA